MVAFWRAYAARPCRAARSRSRTWGSARGGRRWWVVTRVRRRTRRPDPGSRPRSSRRRRRLVRDTMSGVRRGLFGHSASDCRHQRHWCSRRWPRSLRFLVDHDLRVATLREGPSQVSLRLGPHQCRLPRLFHEGLHLPDRRLPDRRQPGSRRRNTSGSSSPRPPVLAELASSASRRGTFSFSDVRA